MSFLKNFLCFALLFVLLVGLASAATDVAEEEGVLVLTEDNFQKVISSEKFVLVEFYAPWCGHCKSLAPEYAMAAQQLKEDGSPVKLGKVDATVHQKLAQSFGVQGYPTLKFIKNGVPSDYSGGRTKKEILQWIAKKSGPASTVLDTAEQLTSYRASHQVVVVGRFRAEADEALNNYISAAGQFDDITFLHTAATDLLEQLSGAADSNGIVLYKKFDEEFVLYDGDFSPLSIVQFVHENSQPLVNDFTASPKLFASSVKDHFFLFLSQGEQFESSIEALKQVAKANKGRVIFSYVDVANQGASRLVDYFAVKAPDTPQVRFFRMESNVKYVPGPNQDWTEFVQSIFDGVAVPYLKSEEPVVYSGKGVRVLTGKDHDQVAKDPKANVLVEYYAPWCGHCKQLAPIYEQLAAEFDNVENVVVANFDGTANEVLGLKVEGFPTLYFYPADGSSAPIQYQGERNLKGLKEFIEKNSVGLDSEPNEL